MRALARPSITPRAFSSAGISSKRILRTQPASSAAASTPSSNAVETAVAIQRLRRIETMPFQTYQFALNYIKKDREVKKSLIKESQKKIHNVEKKQAQTGASQSRRLSSLRRHLEYLKIQADINNPRVKYSFDQGIGELIMLSVLTEACTNFNLLKSAWISPFIGSSWTANGGR